MADFDVDTDWVQLDKAVKNLARLKGLIRPYTRPPYIENALEPHKNKADQGFHTTDNSNVFLVSVGAHDYPLQDLEEYDISVRHQKLQGAWGTTTSYAYVKYAAVSSGGGFHIRLMGVSFAALIKMKPLADFGDLADFAPFYERYKIEFNSDPKAFSAVLSAGIDDDYRKFGTFEGVLFHELLHFKLAQIDGGLRYKALKDKIYNSPAHSSSDEVTEALRQLVNEIWKGWRGWITYKPSWNDHRYIWAEESKYLIRSYAAQYG